MSASASKEYWPPWLFYALGCGIAAWTFYLCRGFYTDDAYISLTYARNLLAGYGLAWQPGQHVEGYTNFLFILLCAALGRLGIDLVVASRLIALSAFAGTLAVVWRYLRTNGPLNPATNLCRALAFALVVSSVPMIAWSLGGLEGDVVAFFLTGGVCLALRLLQGKGSPALSALMGVSFTLGMLMRPDTTVSFIVTMVFLAAVWLNPQRRGSLRFSHLWPAGGVFTAVFIAYTAWRIGYFGDFFPNTYYAKVYGIAPAVLWSRGIAYVIDAVLRAPLLVPMGAAMVIMLALKRQLDLSLVYLALLCAAFLTYVASVGGDFMPDFRFFVPIIPALALLIYHGCHALAAHGRGKALRLYSTLFLVFMLQSLNLSNEAHRDIYVGALSELAVKDYIAAHWPAGSTIAINPAGTLPYFEPQYHYIDMLGLQNPVIARRVMKAGDYRTPGQDNVGHIKGDGNYILSRHPDYIVFGHGWGYDKAMFLGEAEMLENPEFHRDYRIVEVYIDPPAELLPQLERAYEITTRVHKRNGRTMVHGLVLNDRHQLRFIYFQRNR